MEPGLHPSLSLSHPNSCADEYAVTIANTLFDPFLHTNGDADGDPYEHANPRALCDILARANGDADGDPYEHANPRAFRDILTVAGYDADNTLHEHTNPKAFCDFLAYPDANPFGHTHAKRVTNTLPHTDPKANTHPDEHAYTFDEAFPHATPDGKVYGNTQPDVNRFALPSGIPVDGSPDENIPTDAINPFSNPLSHTFDDGQANDDTLTCAVDRTAPSSPDRAVYEYTHTHGNARTRWDTNDYSWAGQRGR